MFCDHDIAKVAGNSYVSIIPTYVRECLAIFLIRAADHYDGAFSEFQKLVSRFPIHLAIVSFSPAQVLRPRRSIQPRLHVSGVG